MEFSKQTLYTNVQKVCYLSANLNDCSKKRCQFGGFVLWLIVLF